jgi:macrolide transport system ATP-binding/permease protein
MKNISYIIELRNVSKTYKMGQVQVQALRNISLKIASGEFVSIIGPSGSGKSTLLHILGFLDRPDSGRYLLGSKDVTKFSDDKLAGLRNSVAGFVFQQFHLLSRMSALENTELPLVYAGKSHLKEKAKEKIKIVGLSERALHRPNELSGGQQQRVAIARALVNNPLIIFADEPTGNLDTKSEKEIIMLLRQLNREGKTVIMVTHEKEIARKSERVVTMRDGEIVSDEFTKANYKKSESHFAENFFNEETIRQDSKFTVTEIIDNLRQGFHSILSNKMRSVLSMLGILIGVASVIAMLALGQGAKKSMSEKLASLGTNVLTVSPGARRRDGVALEAGSVTRFTIKDTKAISELSYVKRASSVVSGRGQIVYGSKNWNTQIQGTGVDYAEIKSSVPIVGRFFTEEELQRREKVALLGFSVVEELFGNLNPAGEIIKLNRINFRVIGVLPKKGSGPGGDRDDVVIIPVTTAMYRLLGKDYIDSISVEIKDISLMEKAEEGIRNLMMKRHHLTDNDQDSFNIMNMADIQETLQSMTQTMTMLIGSIAVISLLVGGIGIMNIMLVSVTERTREIGLRKAIGACKKDIYLQFLIEAVVMTFSGGAIGIIFGAGAAVLLSVFAGWVTIVTFSSVVLATTFSIVVGIGFGLWPARKAAQLNPIEALRYE